MPLFLHLQVQPIIAQTVMKNFNAISPKTEAERDCSSFLVLKVEELSTEDKTIYAFDADEEGDIRWN